MSKKHPSPSARLLLEKIYAAQGQGVKPGRLANAMSEMAEELGLSEPRTILVQNLGKAAHDSIEPDEYGAVKPGDMVKFLKRVDVAKNDAQGGAE